MNSIQPYLIRLTERAGAEREGASLMTSVLRKPAPTGPDSPSISILGHADQRVANGTFAGHPLSSVKADQRSWLEGHAELSHRAAFVDSGEGTSVWLADSTVIYHALWCMNDRSAYVLAGVDPMAQHDSDITPDRLVRRSISPGDTITIPAGESYAIGPGVLAYNLSVPTPPGQEAPAPVPSHGLSRFDGFNRRTICAAGPGFLLERWKISQPLRLRRGGGRWLFVTNLVDPLAVLWDGGSDLIGRAESRLLPASLPECTFVPSGLAYMLTVSVPDLMSDVISPLRLAGYRDDEIAALGTMRSVLGATR